MGFGRTLLCGFILCNFNCQGWRHSYGLEDPLEALVTSTPVPVQEEAVQGLIKRLLPRHHRLFVIEVDPSLGKDKKDVFEIESPLEKSDPRVSIKGTTGVSVAWGLLHYLKYYCGAHVSWEADQLDLPVPAPQASVKIVAMDRLRYYENVCTASYSFAWWTWPRWERHIDWMALNGINIALAFVAQEEIWRRVYHSLNMTQPELDEHFVGPAYLAWGRMGNIKKWMGPLSSSWHRRTLALQHRILRRMRDLGMTPILSAFAGHVPLAITRLFPDANVTRLPAWGHFTDENYTRTLLLDPSDDLFFKIGTAFLREMQREFNHTEHAFSCDTFNEMTPPSSSLDYLASVGKSIFRVMASADPRAIWVMQGWLFRKREFWTRDRAKALLISVPKGRMLVLDLTSEVDPQYARLESYFGQPFVFCFLHNYGGVNGFYGNAEILLKQMEAARKYPGSTLEGIGLTMEGIGQNYAMYDLMLELAWRTQPLGLDLAQWGRNYARRRYGTNCCHLSEAWALLMMTVYNCHNTVRFHGNHILIQHRPSFTRQQMVWYESRDLRRVWDLFVRAAEDQGEKSGDTHCSCHDEWGQLGSFSERGTPRNKEIEVLDRENAHLPPKSRKVENHSPLPQRATFRHDLVDVTRQVLQDLGGDLIQEIREAFIYHCLPCFNSSASLLWEVFDDLDALLASSEDFLLGAWLTAATQSASNPQDADQYLLNARYQITLWGPEGEILDYAVKQWSGLVRDYMKPRYTLFVEELRVALRKRRPFNQTRFNEDVFFGVEKPFAAGADPRRYPAHSEGDSIEITTRIYHKYQGLLKERRLPWMEEDTATTPRSHWNHDQGHDPLRESLYL